jgi:type IV pilus assembly protein PilN
MLLVFQGEELQAKQIKLDKELGAAKEQETKLITLQAKIAQTEQESQALAGAFNLVRPWSAILKEFREITPQGVQISSLIQSPTVATAIAPKKSGVPGAAATKLAATPPTVDSSGAASKSSPSPSASSSSSTAPVAASPAPTTIDSPVVKIEVEGVAQSFNDVNSFILTLKQSPLFNPEDTQLISSELVENKVSLTTNASGKNASSNTTEIVTKSVKYKLQIALKQIPATELLQELERRGAEGLVTRLKTLQQQKVIKP